MYTSLSKRQFLKKLKNKKYENISIIKYIEKSLIQKRGYILKKPKPGTPVILLLSGGLDSITSWNILLEEYRLKVFPLSINNSPKRRVNELKSITFFSDYFSKKYPALYEKPFFTDLKLSELNIPIEKAPHFLHPKSLLEQVNKFGYMTNNLSLGSFSLDPIVAKLFSNYLYLRKNIKIRTCFCAVTSGDGAHIPEQRYTSLRSAMWFISNSTEYSDWQFTSTIFESELNKFWSKADLIKWASQHNLPLEKTWSCYIKGSYHCGYCFACYARKKAFNQAHIIDKTLYENERETFRKKLKKRLISIFKNHAI